MKKARRHGATKRRRVESDRLRFTIEASRDSGAPVVRMVVLFDAECRCCGYSFEAVSDQGDGPEDAARAAYLLGLRHAAEDRE